MLRSRLSPLVPRFRQAAWQPVTSAAGSAAVHHCGLTFSRAVSCYQRLHCPQPDTLPTPNKAFWSVKVMDVMANDMRRDHPRRACSRTFYMCQTATRTVCLCHTCGWLYLLHTIAAVLLFCMCEATVWMFTVFLSRVHLCVNAAAGTRSFCNVNLSWDDFRSLGEDSFWICALCMCVT